MTHCPRASMHVVGILRSTGGSVRRRLAGATGLTPVVSWSPPNPGPSRSLATSSIVRSPSNRSGAHKSGSSSSAVQSNLEGEQPSMLVPKKPRKVNPYRLPPLTTFLASFAPLHAAGWRLDVIPPPPAELGTTSHNASADVLSGADLQGRRMTRAYSFPANRDGWRALTALMARVGDAVEVEDHHPSLTVAPFNDLPSSIRQIITVAEAEAGYVLHVSTHTHTPLPPLGVEGAAFEGKPRPGVTYKDLRLAERMEALVGEEQRSQGL